MSYLMGRLDPTSLFVYVVVLFTAMPIHECAHGLVADRLGDPTARYQGRLTLNPFAHLDLMGSLMMIFVGFGWAKPVQVNPRNFKHPRRDMALSALAGPVSNILMALVVMIAFKILVGIMPVYRYSNGLISILQVLSIMITVNLSLAVFNLLPIPPLDGSKILGGILPDRYYNFMLYNERYVTIILIVLLVTGALSRPLIWLAGYLYQFLDLITYPINLLFS